MQTFHRVTAKRIFYPEREGHTQEITYKIVDENQMEWTDQKGNVTIARRQFR